MCRTRVGRWRNGARGAESSIDNALTQCQAYWLSLQEAAVEAGKVAVVVSGWQAHFGAAGVPKLLIDQAAEQIDRPYLLRQRRQFGG